MTTMTPIEQQLEFEKLAKDFPEEYHKILLEIVYHDERVATIGELAAVLELSPKFIRTALKQLRINGLLSFGTLHRLDEPQLRCGSGYYYTPRTRAFLKHLRGIYV